MSVRAAWFQGGAPAPHGEPTVPALFVELGGQVAVAKAARFCKVCTLGGGCEVITKGRPLMATGYTVYAKTTLLNATHALCTLPPVDAAGIAGLFLSTDAHCEWAQGINNCTWSYANRTVTFEPLLRASFDKRPYLLHEQRARLLLGVHVQLALPEATLKVSVGGRNRTLLERAACTADINTRPFALAGIPAGIYDAWVQLTGTLPGRGAVRVTLSLLLHLTAPPPSGSVVQIDYEHRVLRVNGTQYMIQGYYDVPACGRGNATRACFNLSDIQTQSRAGYSSVLYYNWVFATIDQQRQVLDLLADNGMMLLADITRLMENIACGGTAGRSLKNCTHDATALAAAWMAVTEQVQRWKTHPALLAWYVCDDCFGQYLMRNYYAGSPTLDTYYARIKTLDPHHLLVGANNAGVNFAFTHASELAPRPSLDVVMQEDYPATLAQCAEAEGGAYNSPCAPSTLWPATFEPLVNSPGPYRFEHGSDRSAVTEQQKVEVMRSANWISVLARVPQQLSFRRAYIRSAEAMSTLGQFAVTVSDLSRFTASSVVGSQDGSRVSGNSSAVRIGMLTDTSQNDLCSLVIAVNLAANTTPFTAIVESGRRAIGSALTAMRYDDANRSVKLVRRAHSVAFADTLSSHRAGLYVLCDARASGSTALPT